MSATIKLVISISILFVDCCPVKLNVHVWSVHDPDPADRESARVFNPGPFSQSRIPGLAMLQSRDFGIIKIANYMQKSLSLMHIFVRICIFWDVCVFVCYIHNQNSQASQHACRISITCVDYKHGQQDKPMQKYRKIWCVIRYLSSGALPTNDPD